MPESLERNNPVRREIQGIALLIGAIFVAGSLFGYHPSDPLIWLQPVHPGRVHNLFGTVGAHIAGGLFKTVGFSSYWVALFLLHMAFFCFSGRSFHKRFISLLAFMALVASTSGLLDFYLRGGIIFSGSKIQAGGLLGLWLTGTCIRFLNRTGAGVFLSSLWFISFMSVTGLSLGGIFSKTGAFLAYGYSLAAGFYLKRKERKKRVRKTMAAHSEMKARPKVTITTSPPEPTPAPEQETFSFMSGQGAFVFPPLDLLSDPEEPKAGELQKESLEMNARRLERKLADFGVQGEVVEIFPGPVITMYEYQPAPGVKISRVSSLSDDLALALRAQSIRIVAPIPGKAVIGIEIPNNQREMVYLKEIITSAAFRDSKLKLPLALGKDITGGPVISDLTKMPHLLVAGATGSGKSVSINAMVISLLYKMSPDMVRFLMIDPKRIELSIYQDIPHLLHPVVTQPKDATRALRWAVDEMERRYMLLSDRGARTIETYNRKLAKGSVTPKGQTEGQPEPRPLPYIVIVIDELADLMMASSREVEEGITRLAQMARAAGIHLIIATQRPSVDVLTGIIKANFPARISFQVSSKVDSRTILDAMGAEALLGDGDMLFMPPGVGRITRLHGAFVSEDEIKAVTDFLRKQSKPDYDPEIMNHMTKEEDPAEDDIEMDEKYDQAVEFVVQSGQASISMLQRKLRVGYNRAARMIEAMEKTGIVGPSDGVRPREVYGRRGV
ncbi:MAG: DNA translocase FtsK [Desulfobacteraceae bacterium]|nr:MAG: DNA translocase FtsK [Desulfobacteraceae bacterium]